MNNLKGIAVVALVAIAMTSGMSRLVAKTGMSFTQNPLDYQVDKTAKGTVTWDNSPYVILASIKTDAPCASVENISKSGGSATFDVKFSGPGSALITATFKLNPEYPDTPDSEVPKECSVTVTAVKVEIIKLDLVSNPINPKDERYLGLSKWKTTPETSASEYACGEVGADFEIKCYPDDYEVKLPFKLTLDVNGEKKILHAEDYIGGKHVIELKERITGKIGKYKLEAKWGPAINERQDYWFLEDWESHIKIDGVHIDSNEFLSKYAMYTKMVGLLKKIDMIPSSITKWEPDKWNLKIYRDKGLAQNVWCDHDCPEHKHEGDDDRLCEYAYSGYDYRGQAKIHYKQEYDAAVALANALVQATPIGRIPPILGVDFPGKIADFIAPKLKKFSGIDAQGEVVVGGSGKINYHDHIKYYPCYIFEPFLGENQDNQKETGHVIIAPHLIVKGKISLMKFWKKKLNGTTMIEWYKESAQAAGIKAPIAPLFFKVSLVVAPKGYWEGQYLSQSIQVDKNGRPFKLRKFGNTTGVEGKIYFTTKYKARMFDVNGSWNDALFYTYAYITEDGRLEFGKQRKEKPKIPEIDIKLDHNIVFYATDK